LTKFTAKTINPEIKIIISPILRAGLIFTDEAVDNLPQAAIRHIGMYRDEKTLKPVWYYNKVPMEAPNPEKFYVYITDPMLATGNSLLEAIKLYADKGIPCENIKCLCIISAPQGIENIHKNYPDVEIITKDSIIRDSIYIINDSIRTEIFYLEQKYDKETTAIMSSSDSVNLEFFTRYLEDYKRSTENSQFGILGTQEVLGTDSLVKSTNN
jgi:hypothetical protein